MLGFWACIIVEAATGRGIIGQVVLYLKVCSSSDLDQYS